jgi:hypothetical protein
MRALDRGMCRTLACAIVVCVLSSGAWASEAVVTTYDGRTLTGELISQDQTTVTLLISGIKTPIPQRSIQSIEIKDAPDEQYRKLRAELDDEDLDGRYRLAYQMYEKQWFELAMVELQSMRRDFPDSDKVGALQNVIQSRMDNQRRETTSQTRPEPGNQNNTVTEVTEVPGPEQRLTEEQINALRVYEVDLAEEPRITIKPETIEKLYETYASDDRLTKDRRAFRRLAGHEQLEVLFELQARDLYPEVIIRQDSPAMKAFRSQVHQRYALNYCAANGCHGDNSPGGLFLFRVQPNSDATVYTNFYILNRMKREQGAMIDRDKPQRSLLLQYGIRRDAAATPHPEVKGWRPQFVDDQDPRFGQIADAIDLFWKPAPDYGISYSPPVWRKEADETETAAQPTE